MKIKDLENENMLDQNISVGQENIEFTEEDQVLVAVESILAIFEAADEMENLAMESGNETYMALMCGLVAREINIANESKTIEEILADFNLVPEVLGLGIEADDNQQESKMTKYKEKLKNLKIKKGLAKVASKIKNWFMAHFTRRAAIAKTVAKLAAVNNKIVKKLEESGLTEINMPAISIDASIGSLSTVLGFTKSSVDKILKLKDGDSITEIAKNLSSDMEYVNNKIEKLKSEKDNETTTRKVSDVVKELKSNILGGSTSQKVNLSRIGYEINKAISHLKSIKVSEGENSAELLKQLNEFEKASKTLLTEALKATKKVYSAIDKELKAASKAKSAANESVESGLEDFNMLTGMFGEIERIANTVGYESNEDNIDTIISEAMESLESIDEYEAALESLEEMVVESRIPLQIQALESLAIEKGIAFEAIDFSLYGNMSAGNEASAALVANSNSKTSDNKKSMLSKGKDMASKTWEWIKNVCRTIWNQISVKARALKNLPKVLTAMGDYAKRVPAKTQLTIMKIQINIIFAIAKLLALIEKPTLSEEEINKLAIEWLKLRSNDAALIHIFEKIKNAHDNLTDSDLKYIAKITALSARMARDVNKLNSADTNKLYEKILEAYRNEADAKAKASGDIKKFKKLSREGFADIFKGLKQWVAAKRGKVEEMTDEEAKKYKSNKEDISDAQYA